MDQFELINKSTGGLYRGRDVSSYILLNISVGRQRSLIVENLFPVLY